MPRVESFKKRKVSSSSVRKRASRVSNSGVKRIGSFYEKFLEKCSAKGVSIISGSNAYKNAGLTKKEALVVEIDRLRLVNLRLGVKSSAPSRELIKIATENVEKGYQKN